MFASKLACPVNSSFSNLGINSSKKPTFSGEVHAHSQTEANGRSWRAKLARNGIGSINNPDYPSCDSKWKDCDSGDVGSFAPTSTYTPPRLLPKYSRISFFSVASSFCICKGRWCAGRPIIGVITMQTFFVLCIEILQEQVPRECVILFNLSEIAL